MQSSALHFRRVVISCLLAAGLSACGGGSVGEAETSMAAASSATGDDGRAQMSAVGAKRRTPVTAENPVAQSLTIRAHSQMAGGVGASMEVLINGQVAAKLEVRAQQPTDHVVPVKGLRAGDKVDIVFANDASIGGQDRNLFVSYLTDGESFVLPHESGVVFDAGLDSAAFDGLNVSPGSGAMWGNGALRLTWPSKPLGSPSIRDYESSRFLQQATFGPTRQSIEQLSTQTFEDWINAQIAMPVQPRLLDYVQSMFDQGPEFRPPNGAKYSPDWVGHRFWADAASSPDQLRRRVAFAWHGIFVVSQADSNLYHQARAFAAYQDQLYRHALGNFRDLIEEVALSPAMGLYLSHMRNLKEDPATNRLPDENFARELMQLFTIGLHELNMDGSEKRDGSGRVIETYGNQDVMALAKVFSGWSWGMDDAELTPANFLWGMPDSATTGAMRADVRRMKPYPGQSSTGEKRLFAGRASAATIPSGTTPAENVKVALDTLFAHPNVGPFIGRQLIQRLVTSNPSPGYVQRVAATFNNNGQGVRGDLAAVVRAILLDNEARSAPGANFGKLREPVLRVTHWMRAFDAQSASGRYLITGEPDAVGQRLNYMPSVFGYFRPGYVAPNSALSEAGMFAPEMQIVDESSTAQWINAVELMLTEGIGWDGRNRDVKVGLTAESALLSLSATMLLDHLNLRLFDGRMSKALRKGIVDAMIGIPENHPQRDVARTRLAIYIAMTAPEYLIQR